MQFSAITKNAKNAIAIAKMGVLAKSSVDALQGILIEVKDKKVYLYSKGMDDWKVEIQGAKAINEGTCLINAVDLQDILPPTDQELVFTMTGRSFVMQSPTIMQKIGIYAEEEFPARYSSAGEAVSFDLPDNIADLLKMVAPFAATDETRPVLTGVEVVANEKTVTLTASDGFRLARVSFGIENEAKGQWLIPAGFMGKISRLIEKGGKLTISNNCADFEFSGVSARSTLLGDKFPSVDAIIPKNHPSAIEVSTKEMLDAARSMMDRLAVCVLDPEAGTLSATGQRGETVANVEMKKNGEPPRIGVSQKFLSDALAILPPGVAKIGLKEPKSPILITSAAAPTYLHVIMPMHLPKAKNG